MQFSTGYERLCYWFTIPEYQNLRMYMSAIQPLAPEEAPASWSWSPEYGEAMERVKQWERDRSTIDTVKGANG